LESLKGAYERTVYSNEEAGWTVGILQPAEKKGTVTVVGRFTAIPGESLLLEGSWVFNKKFGHQFEVARCEALAPASLEGLKKYLGSGMIKGIGPVYAERLIERFGLEVPSVIENSPRRLREIEGIGEARQKTIIEGWSRQKEIKDIMLFLTSHGVGPVFANKIHRRYKTEAVRLIRENPYRLAEDIAGIGFRTADAIAASLGVAKDSAQRARAGLLYVLELAAEREGHVYLTVEDWVERSEDLIGTAPARLYEIVDSWVSEPGGSVVIQKVGEERVAYLTRYYLAEKEVAQNLDARLRTPPPKPRPVDWEKFFVWYSRQKKIEFSASQKLSIQRAYEEKVTIVTGGPGTGKSTLVQAIVRLFDTLRLPYLLASPTGRAAQRLVEITGVEAKTLHRLLEFNAATGRFARDEEKPLECDLLIVDEVSMVDLSLFQKLLRALPATSRLILVGDADQLPAVGAGNVLRDLIESGVMPTVRLQEVYRQAAQSHIIRAAHRIHHGEPFFDLHSGDREKGGTSDFYFIEKREPEDCIQLIIELCQNRIPRRFGLRPPKDIQVLAPMKKGTGGTINLNQELQRALNPQNVYLERTGKRFGVGDKVIQIRNNYDLEVFNGDIGVVARLDLEARELDVNFDGRTVNYESGDLDELDLAYAISVHKAQGSEFPAVIFVCLPQHLILLQRNLIYTAVTRGKKLVVVVGSRDAAEKGIATQGRDRRNSRLAVRLREAAVASAD